jgi:hypothetical protein
LVFAPAFSVFECAGSVIASAHSVIEYASAISALKHSAFECPRTMNECANAMNECANALNKCPRAMNECADAMAECACAMNECTDAKTYFAQTIMKIRDLKRKSTLKLTRMFPAKAADRKANPNLINDLQNSSKYLKKNKKIFSKFPQKVVFRASFEKVERNFSLDFIKLRRKLWEEIPKQMKKPSNALLTL